MRRAVPARNGFEVQIIERFELLCARAFRIAGMRDRHVQRDAVHPCGEFRPGPIEPAERSPQLDRYFLGKVIPVVHVARIRTGDLEHDTTVLVQQRFETLLVVIAAHARSPRLTHDSPTRGKSHTPGVPNHRLQCPHLGNIVVHIPELHIKRYLITGLLAFIPVWITWVVFKFVFTLLAVDPRDRSPHPWTGGPAAGTLAAGPHDLRRRKETDDAYAQQAGRHPARG